MTRSSFRPRSSTSIRLPRRRPRCAAGRLRPDLARAADLLAKAERPVILAGGGVHLSQAAPALEVFAHAFGISLAHMLSGKSAIACTDPVSLGILGRYSRIVNDVIETSNVILAIGCKLGEIATKRYSVLPAGKPLIHLDILAEKFDRRYPTTVRLWDDAREGIEALTPKSLPPPPKQPGPRMRAMPPRLASAWRSSAEAQLRRAADHHGAADDRGEVTKALHADGLLWWQMAASRPIGPVCCSDLSAPAAVLPQSAPPAQCDGLRPGSPRPAGDGADRRWRQLQHDAGQA